MTSTLGAITLPFLGEVNLSGGILIIFLLCLLCVITFEFVNGFHDTANAVATVIYTKALKPMIAVPWSGMWNFLGVFVGGIAVAMGILKLIPLNEFMALPVQVGAAMVLAVLVSSIIWNLGTWYFGIPCSSSHTLIGSVIGATLGFTMFYHGAGVNWDKAKEIGLSLILSPVIGFFLAWGLMWVLEHVVKAKSLFHIPHGENDRPPLLIRILLIFTCTWVSFSHGSNDGQKGVGLLMLILIAFLPAKFAIDHNVPDDKIMSALVSLDQPLQHAMQGNPSKAADFTKLAAQIASAKTDVALKNTDAAQTFKFRKEIQTINKTLKSFDASKEMTLAEADKTAFKDASHSLAKVTDFAPIWVIATVSISLGVGTMIGWKRIVVTIGEKIGNEHLNYAQGASAELVAGATIQLSTMFGLPVSTTHVLSSGIAGTMTAAGGTKNLNGGTLKSIAMAWVLTLPVCIAMAFGLFFVFHLFV